MDDEETRSDMIMEDDVLDDENDIQCTNGSRGNQYDSPSDNDTANSEATTELAMSSILSFIDSATSFDDSRNSLTATDILDSVAAETTEHLFARLRRREISQIRICCEDQRRINTIQEKLRHVNTCGRKEWRLASGCIRTWSYEKLKDKLHKAEEDAIDSVEASIEHLIHITGQRMRVELVLKSLYETREEFRIKLTELAIETRDRFVGDEREYSIKNTTPRTKSVYFVLSKRALDSQTEVEDAFEDLLPRLFPKEVARL